MMSISIHIIANQSSYHDDKSTLQCVIRVFCPQLIRNVRSHRRIDCSSIIAHPVNSDLHTRERSWKCYAKNSTYIYIYVCIYYALDNRYGFSISVQPGIDCTTFQFLFMRSLKKKMFFKIFKSFQVCDWLAKWMIMLRFMDLRWPRVYRRSNVGLVDYVAIIVSSWNFQELLPVTKVTSMQKVKVRGQRSRSQRSQPNLTVSGL